MASPTASAQLVGILLEVAAYSVYVTLIPRAYMGLRSKGSHGFLKKYLYFTLFASLSVNTLHVSLGVGRVIYAFTTHTNMAEFAESYLSYLSTPTYVLKLVCVTIIFGLADTLIVLRTYVMWDRSWRILILPVLLLLADLGYLVQFVIIISNDIELTVWPTLIIFASLSWALNLLCSGLIGYRIWRSRRVLRQYFSHTGDHLKNALTVVIESAVVYSLISLMSLFAIIIGNFAALIVSDVTPSLAGIVFLYVIISSSNFKANTAIPDTSIVVNSVTTNRDIREPSDQYPESEIFAARPDL